MWMRSVTCMALKRAFLITFLAAVSSVAWAGAARAQENPDYTAPAPPVEVSEVQVALTTPVIEVTTPPISNLVDRPVVETSTRSLPITGSDAAQLVVVGGVLVAGGAGVLFARRRASI